MPIRGLEYFAKLYQKLIAERGLDLYDSELIKLPAPRYYVLYFGRDERPEREVMQLSDSFSGNAADIEVTATVLNCNEGRNADIMEACEALRGYAHLLALGRSFHAEGICLDDAVAIAVDQCISEGVLADYLIAHKAEVKDMLFTMEDEERAMRNHWENVERKAYEKGLAEGRAEIVETMRANGVDPEVIAQIESLAETS